MYDSSGPYADEESPSAPRPTQARKAISEGDVSYAARLLGRPFVLTGEVVKGAGIGRKFTFPTLNLKPEQEMLPAQGVYVTRTRIDGG